jgi:hypothetical protein
MNSLPIRIERRLGRPGALDVASEMRVGLIILAVAAVFACCFLLGRVTSGTAASAGEAGTSVPATPVAAAVPIHLSDAASIGLTPPKPVVVHHAKPAPAHVSAPSRPATTEAQASAPPVERQVVHVAPPPPPPVTRAPEVPTPAPAPAPRPAPAPSSGGSHSTPSSGGGGSFESSG